MSGHKMTILDTVEYTHADLVKQICQAWIADGKGDDCFWDGWSECPTPEDRLTPKMVMDCIEELETRHE